MKMKARFLLTTLGIILLITFTQCTSPQKLYREGNHDAAVKLALEKLQSDKPNPKHLNTLIDAYTYIHNQDLDRLEFLIKNADSSSWGTIYLLANKIEARQSLVAATSSRLNINLIHEDMNPIIEKSRFNAAEFHYMNGLRNLELSKEYKKFARVAFTDFENTKKYFSNYKSNTNRLLEEAIELGKNHAGYTVVNNTNNYIPSDIDNELFTVALKDIETNFVDFETFNSKNNTTYDYKIVAKINRIIVSPELMNTNNFKEEKTIKDGFEYHYDQKGKVQKDSTGEPIKYDTYKTISAVVTELKQSKKTEVIVDLEFYDNSNRMIKSIPLTAIECFDNNAITYHGERDALNEETKCRIGGNPVPFPSDVFMLANAFASLKHDVKNAVKRNRDIVER